MRRRWALKTTAEHGRQLADLRRHLRLPLSRLGLARVGGVPDRHHLDVGLHFFGKETGRRAPLRPDSRACQRGRSSRSWGGAGQARPSLRAAALPLHVEASGMTWCPFFSTNCGCGTSSAGERGSDSARFSRAERKGGLSASLPDCGLAATCFLSFAFLPPSLIVATRGHGIPHPTAPGR